jgi:type VI secretion system protein ImpG
VDRYYEEELRYLTEAGHEFALKHPERAGFLRLESQDRDPYVERLLEGFAFLAGRVRERLEDDFPEFTQGLLELLFPHYLRPVPAMAWLQFMPRRAALQQTQVIPRGTVVLSAPVGPEGVACRFTTSSDVPLNPVTLEEARLERTPRGRHVIRLRLAFDRGVEPRALVLDPLVIAFHGEPTLTATLHQYLTRHVQHVRFRGVSESPREVPGPDRDAVQAAGFGTSRSTSRSAIGSWRSRSAGSRGWTWRRRPRRSRRSSTSTGTFPRRSGSPPRTSASTSRRSSICSRSTPSRSRPPPSRRSTP